MGIPLPSEALSFRSDEPGAEGGGQSVFFRGPECQGGSPSSPGSCIRACLDRRDVPGRGASEEDSGPDTGFEVDQCYNYGLFDQSSSCCSFFFLSGTN
jgi:hypothetical protein